MWKMREIRGISNAQFPIPHTSQRDATRTAALSTSSPFRQDLTKGRILAL